MSSAQYFRDFVSERLGAVAVEIVSMFEQTMVQYEEKIGRQGKLLENNWKPDTTELQQQCVWKKKKKVNHKRNSSRDQEEQNSAQIKEEKEELFSALDGELHLIEGPPKRQIDNYELERDSEQFVPHNSFREFINGRLTVVAVEIISVFDETIVQYERTFDHHQRPFDFSRRPEVNSTELSQLQESEIGQNFSEQPLSYQARDYILDQEDPEPRQIKDREEGFWTDQEGEQHALKQESETFRVPNVIQSRKKGTKVSNSTSGCRLGEERGAATQEAPEEPSESEAESIRPPSASHMDSVAGGHQPIQNFLYIDGELTPTVAAKSKKKRKRELTAACFTEEQEQDLIEWLKAPEQNCLLSKKHPNYINKDLKETLWDQKAEEMGKPSDQLKRWYANMRSRFGKLKQIPPGSSNTELTARDRWILYSFQFLKPYLIVHVNRRGSVNMKAKVRAMPALAATEGFPQCESDVDAADQHPSAATQPDADASLGFMATEYTEATRNNTDELQGRQLNKLSKAEKSPLRRQKDIFADFIKEITYTFPLVMWLRFQGEVNSLLQKYQFELYQVPLT